MRSAQCASLATIVACVSVLACDVTSPDRTDSYGFRLQPENLVFTWPADRLPVQYFVPALGQLPDYVRNGLELWHAQFLYSEFSGTVTADSARADVRVILEGGVPPAATLTLDPPVPACDGSTSATVLDLSRLAGPLTIRVRWFSGFSATDVANCLARVTAHEIGHSLGLFQHSQLPTDLMFGSPRARAPSSRDRSTAHVLYHSEPDLRPADRP